MQQTKEISLEKIKVGEHDQRMGFDEETLAGLVSSIPRVGLLYPILVKAENDGYLIIDGHTRFEAFKRLGRATIPCTIAGTENIASAEIAFAGNFFRKDLSPVELASAISDVFKAGALTIEQLASGFHKSPHWVQSMIAICDWPQDVLEAIHVKNISLSAASNLALVTDDTYRQFLVSNAVDQGASARTTSAWLQAWRSMQPASEAIQAEPVVGQSIPQPIVPQAPCFCCSQIFAVNEMSHVPVCGACVQILRQAQVSSGPG